MRGKCQNCLAEAGALTAAAGPVAVVAGPRARPNVVGVPARGVTASANMMQWWHTWQQWRQWHDENKDVPLEQFRNSVKTGSTWYQTPGKQRWAEWELFRREHLTARILTIAGLILTFIFGLLALWK
jgi:hypothetical protein